MAILLKGEPKGNGNDGKRDGRRAKEEEEEGERVSRVRGDMIKIGISQR